MSTKVLNGLDVNSQRITSVSDPSASNDAATKQYVDNVAAGRDWKESVRGASTANLAVATALVNGLVHDGVTYATGDRILLKNQTTASENGIYVIVASGAAPRASDADSSAEVNAGMTTSAEEGTVNGDKRYVLTTNNPIVLGTTSLVFTVDSSGGAAYATVQENGSGLTQRSTLNFNSGLIAVDNSGSTRTDVDIDTAVVVRKFAASCVATTNPQTFNHALNTSDVTVSIQELSTKLLVLADVTVTDANNISVNFGGAPTSAQYRVVVHG